MARLLATVLFLLILQPVHAQPRRQIKHLPALQYDKTEQFIVPTATCTNPILFVHGLDSDDRTWRLTLDVLRNQHGLGSTVVLHYVLNIDFNSTYWYDDIGGFEANIPSNACLFAINFSVGWVGEQWIFYEKDDEPGQSESNASSVVKQGIALGDAIWRILEATGKPAVKLVGHSMGGLAIREYLQRNDGSSVNWVDPSDTVSGHKVTAAITYGTPHLGSNASLIGLGNLVIDLHSEAVRDLRWEYLTTGIGRYLFGGLEGFSIFFHNTDVNADGDENDRVTGINAGFRDNPQMPLPRNISYLWIVSEVFGAGGDGLVAKERAWLYKNNGQAAPGCCADAWLIPGVSHFNQTRDHQTIVQALGYVSPVSAEEIKIPPTKALLHPNYPNPFSRETTISVDLSSSVSVVITVYDATGRSVETLVSTSLPPGTHRYTWNASDHPSGIYFYRLQAGAFSETKSMLLIKN